MDHFFDAKAASDAEQEEARAIFVELQEYVKSRGYDPRLATVLFGDCGGQLYYELIVPVNNVNVTMTGTVGGGYPEF